ncbi:MAG: hypothetical protein Q8906_14905, partial [Bacillota bacterium]|nr:hypothetical protein [Bacillota bacterium]
MRVQYAEKMKQIPMKRANTFGAFVLYEFIVIIKKATEIRSSNADGYPGVNESCDGTLLPWEICQRDETPSLKTVFLISCGGDCIPRAPVIEKMMSAETLSSLTHGRGLTCASEAILFRMRIP